LISLKRSRPRVARINLTPGRSRGAAGSGGDQEKAMERRRAWIPVLALVVLVGIAAGYFLFMASQRRGAPGPDAQPIVAMGGRFAQRFGGLLARSDVAGLVAEGPSLGPRDSGRWDPFRPLVELGPAIKPIVPDVVAVAPVEPEPEPEPPSPPEVALTGVLKSGGRAVAILRVAGQTQLTRVGESPFDGAVVRSIDDKSLVISFFGQDIHYSLGGEQQ